MKDLGKGFVEGFALLFGAAMIGFFISLPFWR